MTNQEMSHEDTCKNQCKRPVLAGGVLSCHPVVFALERPVHAVELSSEEKEYLRAK